MKIIKILLKAFVICVLLITIVFACIALYMKFYGKDILEGALSNMLGSKVRFEGISLNLDKYAVNFRGFTILSEIGFEKDIFNAEKFTLILNKEKFEKEKKIVFEEILIIKGVLNIERNRKGVFNVSYNRPPKAGDRWGRGAVAYADGPTGGGLYNFAKNVRKLVIQDSLINFNDRHVSRGPFAITCDKLNVVFRCGPEPTLLTGSIPVNGTISFRIPNKRYRNGEFFLRANMAAYRNRVDMDTTVETRYIDLMQFLPYFESYTPFSFKEGLFSSTTHYEVHNNRIDSLTTMVFHRLDLKIDPGAENAQFLNTSVNRLTPYLTSGSGEIVFDFVIRGPVDNPQVGIGPKVKFAIGMVAIEELGKMLQQMQ